MEILDVIVGGLVVVLNILPLVFRKYDYIKLTATISFLVVFIYFVFRNAGVVS